MLEMVHRLGSMHMACGLERSSINPDLKAKPGFRVSLMLLQWLLVTGIGAAEQKRAEIGWVEPENVPVDQPGLLRAEYTPGDIGFDPLGLKPEDAEELKLMQTKELQNGRLAMIAAAGFLAQELVDGKGIVEHLMG